MYYKMHYPARDLSHVHEMIHMMIEYPNLNHARRRVLERLKK